jgi:hypothetical protein
MQEEQENKLRLELRHANRRMLTRYADWADYMLTITFRDGAQGLQPSEAQVRAQLRHLQCSLNCKVWKNRSKHSAKACILSIPIIEGARTQKRIHAHILLGNVKSKELLQDFMYKYVKKSRTLAQRYDIADVYDADGVAWYLAKETATLNPDAIAWDIASIPSALLPK